MSRASRAHWLSTLNRRTEMHLCTSIRKLYIFPPGSRGAPLFLYSHLMRSRILSIRSTASCFSALAAATRRRYHQIPPLGTTTRYPVPPPTDNMRRASKMSSRRASGVRTAILRSSRSLPIVRPCESIYIYLYIIYLYV